jgi:hypothetical protein
MARTNHWARLRPTEAFTAEANCDRDRTEPLLLPNRPVVVDSFPLKEAMMHHAEPKQQKKDRKESDESDL